MSDFDYMMVGFHSELEKVAKLKGLAGLAGSAARKGLQSATSGAKAAGGVVGRFGQRQVHALTGWTPEGGVQAMRGGAYPAEERLRHARKGFEAARAAAQANAPAKSPGLVGRLMGEAPGKAQHKAVVKATKEFRGAEKGLEAAQKAEDMGLTNLPGYVKSMVKNGPGKTLKAGLAEQWHGVGPVGKSLMVGLPAMSVGGELARESKPGERGRVSRAGERLGEIAYMMGPVPLAGQMVAHTAISKGGKGIGALFDRKPKQPKSVPAPPSLEPAGGEAVPGETIVSDRAMGVGGFQ